MLLFYVACCLSAVIVSVYVSNRSTAAVRVPSIYLDDFLVRAYVTITRRYDGTVHRYRRPWHSLISSSGLAYAGGARPRRRRRRRRPGEGGNQAGSGKPIEAATPAIESRLWACLRGAAGEGAVMRAPRGPKAVNGGRIPDKYETYALPASLGVSNFLGVVRPSRSRERAAGSHALRSTCTHSSSPAPG